MTAQPEPEFSGDWRVFEPLQLGPILEHALEAFGENGFHGTTVRDLARRVGVTVPALYYHHENKEAVLVTLLDAAVSTSSTVSARRSRTAAPTRSPASRMPSRRSCST